MRSLKKEETINNNSYNYNFFININFIMKRFTLLKTMLLLCALIVGSGNLWAAEETIASFSNASHDDWTINGNPVYGSASGYQLTASNISIVSPSIDWSAYNNIKIVVRARKYNGPSNSQLVIYVSQGSTTLTTFSPTSTSLKNYGPTAITPSTGAITICCKNASDSKGSGVSEITITGEPSGIQHTLSSEVTPVGVGTVTLGSTSVVEGQSTSIEATVTDADYRFKNWTTTSGTIAEASSASTTFTMGTSDAVVTANFEVIPTHTLGSAISPVGAGTVELGSSTVREGATTTATASANEGYKFTGWSISGTGATLSSTSTNPTTVTMGTADATVTATFEAVTTHAISYSVNGVVVNTQNVPEDDDIDLSAPGSGIPSGYVFKGWVTEANKIDGTTDTDPSANYVTSATSTANITYYCVMAIESESSETATLTASHTTNATGYDDHEYTDDKGNTWSGFNNEPYDGDPKVARYGFNSSASGGTPYFESPTFPGNVSSITIGAYNAAGSARTFNLNSSNDNNNHDLGTISISANSKTYPDVNASLGKTAFKKFYMRASAAIGFSYISVTYNSTTSSNYCTTVPTASVTIASACTDGKGKYYGTYSNSSAFVVPEDMTIAEIGIDEGKLDVQEYSAGDIVPANTGVMISATSAGEKTLTLASGGSSVLGTDNCLKPSGDAGIDKAAMAAAAPSCKYYRLTMHNGTQIGYYWGADDGAAFALTANKAYLAVPDVDAARSGFNLFGDDDTTGIEAVDINTESANVAREYYNLNGQRVANPSKGLYIVNGKKVIIK